MSLLCVAATCQPLIGEHLSDCDNTKCRGCGPKRANPPLQVCNQCRNRITDRLGKLPGLHEDLLTPTRSRGGGRGEPASDGNDVPASLAETRAPGADGALSARSEIRITMVAWTKILLKDLGIGYPSDAIEALMDHVSRHALTLLATEHAELFAAEIDWLYGLATRAAYPAPPAGQALGECPACGTTVRATDTSTAACHGCGIRHSIDEWLELFVGDLSAEPSATAADLVAWLSKRHNRAVSYIAVRLWVSKGVRLRLPDGSTETVKLARVGTDGPRALYSVADAARIADALYGAAKTGVSA